MNELRAKLFGAGQLTLDGERVTLPFKQAEALLYYLLVEKEAFRPRIADIIWGDSLDEHKVRSNMRNAIYVIRRALGRDFLVTDGKSMLRIDPSIRVELDVDRLHEPELTDFSFYTGDFLEDFYLRDNEYYNEWLLSTRQHCRELLLERMKAAIDAAFHEKRYRDCEANCQRLMALDAFDEFSYLYLIELYRARGEYSSAVALYDRLEKLLSEELFQSPSEEITSLVQTVRQERSEKVLRVLSQKERAFSAAPTESTAPFLGRGAERGRLAKNMLRFLAGTDTTSLLVLGEAGIGKTQLLRTALADLDGESYVLYETCCYRAEEDYVLKPWQTIFEQLGRDLEDWEECRADTALLRAAVSRAFPYLRNGDRGETIDQDEIATENSLSNQRALAYALLRLARRRRMLLYFDDLQWADSVTIALIRDLLTTDKNRSILFLFACRDEHHQYVGSFLEEMKAARFLTELRLARFSFEETVELASALLPERFQSEPLRRQLFRETEGNPFFIVETVNNLKFNGSVADITPNMRDTIRLRTMSLPSEERSILDLLSFFFDGASFELLLALSGKEEYTLITILEQLIAKQLIREVVRADGVIFQFSHQKILEYVYGELSVTKRRILHERIAAYMERQLTGTSADDALYTRLMYHSRRAGNAYKYLKYYVEYVYKYLNLSHEYYPVLSAQTASPEWDEDICLDSSDRTGITRVLGDIRQRIEQCRDRFTDEDRHGFLSDYYHMMGRFHIRKVEYEQGEPYIQTLLALNRGVESEQCRANMIKAYRQMICVHIDRYEPERMREDVEAAFAVLGEDGKAEERAIWMRLSGLCSIMSGRCEEGHASLTRAIAVFEQSAEKEQYLFNLAASYAWLGEVERSRKHYPEAMAYYDHAISLCNENFLTGGVATFYTYAGQAALDGGDYEGADYYLSRAVEEFSRVELVWGRGLAFAYYGLLCFEEEQYEKALSLFVKADDYARRLESSYELGVLHRMYAQLRLAMERNETARFIFSGYLKESAAYYFGIAQELLRAVYSPVDQDYLRLLAAELENENTRQE